jgi:hypothetical protein
VEAEVRDRPIGIEVGILRREGDGAIEGDEAESSRPRVPEAIPGMSNISACCLSFADKMATARSNIALAESIFPARHRRVEVLEHVGAARVRAPSRS